MSSSNFLEFTKVCLFCHTYACPAFLKYGPSTQPFTVLTSIKCVAGAPGTL